MTRALSRLMLLLSFSLCAAAQVHELTVRAEAAMKSYDAQETATLIDALRPEGGNAEETRMLLVRLLLFQAELYRIDFEDLPEKSYAARRPLGKLYRKKMDAATARAVELDPRNPRVYVTLAKPYVFAPEEHGRDYGKALAALDQALALDPHLEQARLLRAHVLKLLGKAEESREILHDVLRDNPACRPAQRELAL
ncbi:MAG: tetratricopeptide repeat protein [Candidatus Hydrogenedentes bacterium]|nr:tetratricopeptide repeat protein [Candidatus Hydrogenedentota bacterium]